MNSSKSIELTEPLSVRDLAERLETTPISIIKKLMAMGVMANINQTLDVDTATLVSEELGYSIAEPQPVFVEVAPTPVEAEGPDRFALYRNEPKDKLQPRPPVVTILGHVDHGKTTLLDRIRQTKVVDGEAGGITQHIGAYQVRKQDKDITFIDTPGHEAFTAMRRRGAAGADIAILVVAADDGMMPQTYEALDHIRAAGAPIIVALNKVDRDNANIERVYSQLSDVGLIPEAYGGDTPVVLTSALKNQGIDELLDYILIVADLHADEIVANPNRAAQGVIIEAVLDPKKGATATILVQNGTLKATDSLLVGTMAGRVRAMFDWQGKIIKSAPPSTPVRVLGLPEVPRAGDRVEVMTNDREARNIAEQRRANQIVKAGPGRITLEDVYSRLQAGDVKTLNLILKVDVDGSLEPIVESLKQLNGDDVTLKILRSGAGNITENDVMLASASEAIILGFGVAPERNVRDLAEQDGVEIRSYNIIYKLLEDMELAMKGMLEPVYADKVTGKAEIRAVFKISKKGNIAGSYVLEGKILRNGKARIYRNKQVVFDGEIDTLKRFQEDVREVATGFECGIAFEGYNDLQTGDIVECYVKERVA
jgi:translation initiation factor IF-2